MTGKHHKKSWWRLGALRRRLGGHHHQDSSPRVYLSEIVDGRDGWAHLVTEEAYAQGLREGTGFFMVLCGVRIPVASMAAPPERPCFPCHERGARPWRQRRVA